MGSFDVAFMGLKSSLNSENYAELSLDGMSRILQPLMLDHIQVMKREAAEKVFDGMLVTSRAISKDFIMVLTGTHIQLFSALGIRNFPTMTPEVNLAFNMPLSFFENDFQSMKSIVDVSTDSRSHLLEDEITLYCLNKNYEIVKLQKTKESSWNILGFKVTNLYERNEITLMAS